MSCSNGKVKTRTLATEGCGTRRRKCGAAYLTSRYHRLEMEMNPKTAATITARRITRTVPSFALLPVGVAAGDECVGVVWIDPERLIIILNRLIDAALVRVRETRLSKAST